MAYETILLEKTVIEDPFLFPESQDNVLMFLGAKASVSFDERVRDVRASLTDLERCDRWIKAGMPDEGIGDHIVPTDEQIEKARFNTLQTIYHNPKVWGLYIHCRREDIEALFESADKAAVFLSSRTPITGSLGHHFNLRSRGEAFGFRGKIDEKPARINGEPETAEFLRDVISLSASFAVAVKLFHPVAPQAFPNQMFFPHIPKTIRSMLLMPSTDQTTLVYDYKPISNEGLIKLNFTGEMESESRSVIFPVAAEQGRFLQSDIEIVNSDGVIYKGPMLKDIFFAEIFAPLMNYAIRQRGRDRTLNAIEKHLDILALSRASEIPRADFIRDFIAPLQ